MPTSTIRGGGRLLPRAVDDRLDVGAQRVASRPRSPSLAPVSITSTAAGSRSSQSIRRRAPADVSPLTPALTATNRSPAESILRCSSAG